MRDVLKEIYARYPEVLLAQLGADESRVDMPLRQRLRSYRQRQLRQLDEAHVFRIEREAMDMLFGLIRELSAEALDDVFGRVRLPFPVLLLECITEDGNRRAGLVSQEAGQIASQTFAMAREGCLPSLLECVLADDGQVETLRTPTLELLEMVHRSSSAQLDEEASHNRWFIKLAVSLATLIQHKGMLEIEERAAYSRAERRRADREGRPLPATRISVIRLGDAGRAQRAAMRGEAHGDDRARAPVRAHWVRGHFMRNPSGGLSWRMPHIRGAGPLVAQIRSVKP